MRDLIPPYIDALKPYTPGKPIEELRRERGLTGEILKLASNENPLGASPRALEAAHKAFTEAHYYPDGAAFELRTKLAERFDVGFDEVITGNGSNELIELIIRAFSQHGEHAIASEHSFVMYQVCLQAHGVETRLVPARDPMTHDLRAMAHAVQPDTRLVWIANPNNPTGTYNPREELVAFFEILNERGMRPVVIMDEAYFEYAIQTEDYPDSLQLRHLYDRMISLRTFSKCYGMAAFRVGYGIGSPELIGALHRIRAPFNVGRIAQAAAVGALDDDEFVQRSVEMNARGYAQVTKDLNALGLEPLPSKTNFVLCPLPFPAAVVYDKLLDHGVIVRSMTPMGLPNCIRITIGLPEQNTRMAHALKLVLEDLQSDAS